MRIVTIATSYPRHHGDHAGRFVHDMNAAFVELGHEVTTIAPAADAPGRRPSDDAGDLISVDHGGSRLFYGDGIEANLTKERRPWRAIRRWIEGARRTLARLDTPDLIVPHWIWPNALPALDRGGQCPIAAVGHGADLHLLRLPLIGRFLSRELKHRLRAVHVTSARGARVVDRRLRPARIAVGPMGVDDGVFHHAPMERDQREEFLLGVGRLVRLKGFDLLIDAASRTGHSVVIVGDGPERDRLQRRARIAGVTLQLLGAREPIEVAALMRRANAVVIPSRRGRFGREEGCPVVAVEALRSRAPLVATRVGGLRELLPEHALIDPGDIDALVAWLRAPRRPGSPRTDVPLTRREVASRLLSLVGE